MNASSSQAGGGSNGDEGDPQTVDQVVNPMAGENETTVVAMRGRGARSVDLGRDSPNPTATTPRPAAGTAAAANAPADVWNVDDGTWCSWMGKTGAIVVAIYVFLLIHLSFVVSIHSTRLLSVRSNPTPPVVHYTYTKSTPPGVYAPHPHLQCFVSSSQALT
jgi:hypothetical protein